MGHFVNAIFLNVHIYLTSNSVSKVTDLLLKTETHRCKPTYTGQSPTFLVLGHFKYMRCRKMFQRQVADPTHARTHFCVHCMLSYKSLRDNIVLTKISSVTHHWGCCTTQEAGWSSRNYNRQTTRSYSLMYVDPSIPNFIGIHGTVSGIETSLRNDICYLPVMCSFYAVL